jgi:hypothetical protein
MVETFPFDGDGSERMVVTRDELRRLWADGVCVGRISHARSGVGAERLAEEWAPSIMCERRDDGEDQAR